MFPFYSILSLFLKQASGIIRVFGVLLKIQRCNSVCSPSVQTPFSYESRPIGSPMNLLMNYHSIFPKRGHR